MYAQAAVPEPIHGDWSRSAEDVPSGFMGATWMLNNADRFTPELIRDCRRAYYALITQVDYNLGILLARLRELNLLDNTTIIFTTDHGEMLGDHHMGAKSLFLEGAAHIPLLLRPAKCLGLESRRGAVCDALVCLADLLPTCLAATGATALDGQRMDGVNLLPIINGAAGRTTLFGECQDYHCVWDGDFKYHFSAAGGAELLFNMREDPREQRELIRAGAHAAVHAALREKLRARLAQYRHPAARDGRLAATHAAPDPRLTRGNWPGFHSPRLTCDVSH
jgi:arylsulfatase A-like enzyme